MRFWLGVGVVCIDGRVCLPCDAHHPPSTYTLNVTSHYVGDIKVPAGTGSGFVWDENGYIVTNYHVIRSAESAQVNIKEEGEGEGRYWLDD